MDPCISEKKCPDCGGDIEVEDTMFMKMWHCVNPECDYEDTDW